MVVGGLIVRVSLDFESPLKLRVGLELPNGRNIEAACVGGQFSYPFATRQCLYKGKDKSGD